MSDAAANKPATATKPTNSNRMMVIGGAILALIALCGIAISLIRRRREQRAWHGEWEGEPEFEHETVVEESAMTEPRHDSIVHDEQPEVVAPSAFSWGATAPAADHAERDADDDRLPGETWVQRAYRGPSANNPSVSLKNRLRRAAFFDKRERDVAAGLAEPVDPNAGLPDAMADEQEREFA